jgi:hypothetical protein
VLEAVPKAPDISPLLPILAMLIALALWEFFCFCFSSTQGVHLSFGKGFFEIGSHELFPQAVFEPDPSDHYLLSS